MSKKRSQKKENSSNKKTKRKRAKNKQTSRHNIANMNKKIPPKDEVQTIITQNILTPIKLEQKNQTLEKENIPDYYSKSLYNTFEIYSSGLFEQLLKEESKTENIVRINEKILSNFDLTKDFRKYAFKYLAEILEQYQIPIKFYFKTVLVFDSFLVNYSKINENDKIICMAFFKSKIDNKFSTTKLIVFTLCCFYIVNQIYNSRNFDLKCLVNWNNKEEMTYEEINDLIYDILEVINCEINILGIYDFINLFIFDLNKRIKIISNENIFINCNNKNVNYLAMKIVQDISLNDIIPSTKALGIIMFSIEYSKFLTEKCIQNEKINFLVENWLKNVKNLLVNYNYEDIKRVIQWLNNYINNN